MNNSKITQCTECKANISFVRTAKDKWMPVDAGSLSEEDLEDIHSDKIIYYRKDHTSHFATCTNPKKFRRVKNEIIKK
jgi:hypothetical protein